MSTLGLGLGLEKINIHIGDSCSPTVLTNPTISGSLQVGDTLTVSGGTFSGTTPITYSYQWKGGATPIGTNSTTYVIVSADLGQNITCEKTATNSCGDATGVSNTLVPEYNPLAQDYFDRVVANGDSSLTSGQKSIINAKFEALIAAGITSSHVDRLFADKYCYTEIQALTPWIWNGVGTGLATVAGSPTFTAGIGWTHNGSSYIDMQFNPAIDNSVFTLDDNGIYHAISLREPVGAEYWITTGSIEVGNKRIYGFEYYAPPSNIYFSNNCGETDAGFMQSGTISNYQQKRTTNLETYLKINGGTNYLTYVFSVAIPNLNVYRGAANGTTPKVPTGTVDEWICYGDSTLDKDIIATALAT